MSSWENPQRDSSAIPRIPTPGKSYAKNEVGLQYMMLYAYKNFFDVEMVGEYSGLKI